MSLDRYCAECNTLLPKEKKANKFCDLNCANIFIGKRSQAKHLAKYNLNPKLCLCCEKPLEYEQRTNTFCSNRCAAIKNNKTVEYKKRGPEAKWLRPRMSRVKFYLCSVTGKYYSSRNPDGTARKLSPYVKSDKEKYYDAAKFKFRVYDYPEEFDLKLLDQQGWYTCPGKKRKNCQKNTDGLSRDHIISVNYGFKEGIDPSIIAHPANCRIVQQRENIRKHDKCDMTVEELLEKIKLWDQKYKK